MQVEARILVTVGTKAQFIKMAPVLKAFDQAGVVYDLVYTGQHSETFSLLERTFGVRTPDQVLVPNIEVTTKQGMLSWSIKFWRAVWSSISAGLWRKYQYGLVHGDTISAIYCAIAMRLSGMSVVHIEAGLRSKSLFDPFPEEIIRRLISKIASVHFAPDNLSVANMKNARGDVIHTHGNTMRDALRMALGEKADGDIECGQGKYALVSMHRNENLSNAKAFDSLMKMVIETAQTSQVKFVLHPATRSRLEKSKWLPLLKKNLNIELLQRMDYPDFVELIMGCSFLMTDGGSNQEEAAMLGVPTIILRKNTERMDGIGDNVVLSDLSSEAVGEFVQKHCGKKWTIRAIEKSSPSIVISQWLAKRVN
ncbi:UDP-N-acetylglucosamine 2-epimerase [Comamonas sp. JUb58]|uniref:UDP-N-acetyl glucosamine 2-epimerase n=1 Tax=Comamonas sp. JUb58 TaxID=2485114 RepID=UPI00105D8E73|nr:UDP-N-acetylglucosamine 2-epimerase [Comamonas sp. JUb58]TDS82493.1 UDP-N-acetylglucosamine 2-epimerase (non-hydrolysing) [Comamonas sp. JUb58]